MYQTNDGGFFGYNKIVAFWFKKKLIKYLDHMEKYQYTFWYAPLIF